jgi:hypothetical protein
VGDAVQRRRRRERIGAVVRRVSQQELAQRCGRHSLLDRALHAREGVDLQHVEWPGHPHAGEVEHRRRFAKDEVVFARLPDALGVAQKLPQLAAGRLAQRAGHARDRVLERDVHVELHPVVEAIAKRRRWGDQTQVGCGVVADLQTREAEHAVDDLGQGEHAWTGIERDAVDGLGADLATKLRGRLQQEDLLASRAELHGGAQAPHAAADDDDVDPRWQVRDRGASV